MLMNGCPTTRELTRDTLHRHVCDCISNICCFVSPKKEQKVLSLRYTKKWGRNTISATTMSYTEESRRGLSVSWRRRKKDCLFLAKRPARILTVLLVRDWMKPQLSWRSLKITCLSLPSFFFVYCLRIFAVILELFYSAPILLHLLLLLSSLYS